MTARGLAVAAVALLCAVTPGAALAGAGPATATARHSGSHSGEEGLAVRRRARPSPYATPAVRSFVGSRSDFSRSTRIAAVVVPLVLLLLVERAVVLVRGRRAALFLVFIVPLVAMVFLLFYVRLRVYAGG